MKKIAILFLLVVSISIAYAQQIADNTKITNTFTEGAAFNWTETDFDFGKIKVNEPATHKFTFINKGSSALVISSVQASCGCTVTEYSKEPIAPGQQGYVKATYNAAKVGVFSKTVSIQANTNDVGIQLSIKGEVTN